MKKIFENKKKVIIGSFILFLLVIIVYKIINNSNLKITELGELQYPRVNLQVGEIGLPKHRQNLLLILGDVYLKDKNDPNKKYSKQGELFDLNTNTLKLVAPSHFSNKYINLISFYHHGKILNVKVVKESPDAKYGIEVYDYYTNTWKLLKTKPRARVSDGNIPLIKSIYYKRDYKNKKEKGKILLLISGGIDEKTRKPIKTLELIDVENDCYFKKININAEDYVWEIADFYERFEPDQLRKIYVFYGNNKSTSSNIIKEQDISNEEIKDLYSFTPIGTLQSAYLITEYDPNGKTSLQSIYECLLMSKDNKIEIIDVKTKKNRQINIPKKLKDSKLIKAVYFSTGVFFIFEKDNQVYIAIYDSYGENSINILGHFARQESSKYWFYGKSYDRVYLLNTDSKTYKTEVMKIKTKRGAY